MGVKGAVGADRHGAAELRDVEQLDLQGVARAEDVAVIYDAAAAGGAARRHYHRADSAGEREGSRGDSR